MTTKQFGTLLFPKELGPFLKENRFFHEEVTFLFEKLGPFPKESTLLPKELGPFPIVISFMRRELFFFLVQFVF